MNKIDLSEEVFRAVEMTRKEAESVVDAICDGIVQSLRAGVKVEVRGFGSFRIRERKPRMGRNPKTGAAVPVPAKKVPYYRPSKELIKALNATAPDQQ